MATFKALGGAADAVASIRFVNTGLTKKIRDLEGQFQSIQSEAFKAHREIATSIQELQLRILKDEIAGTGRPQRPGALLVNAVDSRAYVDYTAQGFTVGTDAVLNRGLINTYWRHIEFGTDLYVGRILTGYFEGADGRRYAPNESRFRQDPRLRQVYDAAIVARTGGLDSERKGIFAIRINRPIPEYAFMRRGQEAFPPEEIDAVYRKWLGQYGLRIGFKRQ